MMGAHKVQDPDMQPLFCAWAEAELRKAPFAPAVGRVIEVKFEEEHDYGYSEWTPGAGASINLYVRTERFPNKWQLVTSWEEGSLAEAILSVGKFSLEFGS